MVESGVRNLVSWTARAVGLAALVFVLAGCGGGGSGASSATSTGTGTSGATVQFTVSVDSTRSRDVDAAVTEFAVTVLDEDQEDDLIEPQVFARTSTARTSQKLTVQSVPVTGNEETVIVEGRNQNHDTVAVAMVTRTLQAGDNEMTGIAEACISGKLTFDRVGEVANHGLNYDSITPLPIAGAAVELIDANGGTVLSTGVTEADGTYRLPIRGSATQVKVKAWARSSTPGIVVVDNTTSGRPVYSMLSDAVDPEPAVLDLNADCGWDRAQKKYARPRTAGPSPSSTSSTRPPSASWRPARTSTSHPLGLLERQQLDHRGREQPGTDRHLPLHQRRDQPVHPRQGG